MLRRVPVKEMIEAPPVATRWQCDGVAAPGSLSVVAGRPGEGKSWLALGLAKGCAHGEVIAGIACRYGNTVYVDAENGEREMTRRAQKLGLMDHVDFLFPDGTFDLEENLPGLCFHISTANLVILDGFRSLWHGDENDSRAVTKVLSDLDRVAKEYDLAIVLLHHMSKTGGYRGTGAIAAVPQIVIEIEADGPKRTMEWKKCRIGPAPFQHSFRIEGGTESVELRAS